MSAPSDVLAGKLIAFFHHSSDLYGSDKVLLELAQAVQARGGRAVVLLPDAGPLTVELQKHGIEFHTLEVLKLSRSMATPTGLVRLLWNALTTSGSYDRVFRGRRVDLVHSNTVAVLGGALWSRRRHIPHLWHVHEIIQHPDAAAYALPLLVRLLADHVVCNSKATRHWLLSRQPRLAPRCAVIVNGVDGVDANASLDPAVVATLHRDFRPAGAQLAVGLVGRFNRWKGQHLLMDAADLLHQRGIEGFSVVFCGSAPPGQEHFQRALQARIARSPLRQRVVVKAFTPDIWPVYGALDIACAPSTEPEPFGLVAVEAMTMGKPMVVADHGGLSEIVVDGSTGFTVTPGDAHALADGLHALLTDAGMRHRMGQAGSARVLSCFQLDRMMDRFSLTWRHAMGLQP